MTNLILTPTHVNNEHSQSVLEQMMKALDTHSTQPFLHILIDDNSRAIDLGKYISSRRRAIKIYSDQPGMEHKQQQGQALQLGLDYAHQAFWNQNPNPQFGNVFIIESDVIVKEDWDAKMTQEEIGRAHV